MSEKSFAELVADKIQSVQVMAEAGKAEAYQTAAVTCGLQKRALNRKIAQEDRSASIDDALDAREEMADKIAERIAAKPELEQVHNPSAFKAKQRAAGKAAEQATESKKVLALQAKLDAALATIAAASIAPLATLPVAPCTATKISKGNGKKQTVTLG